MICPPVLMFLKAMLRGGGEIKPLDRLLALAILRRLSLQLQVMAWFEHAMNHSFVDTRVEDLATFAFSALRPHWPRRLLALSHRSRDVKTALMQLQAWGNFRYSIDALFPPHWETTSRRSGGSSAPYLAWSAYLRRTTTTPSGAGAEHENSTISATKMISFAAAALSSSTRRNYLSSDGAPPRRRGRWSVFESPDNSRRH